MEILAVYRKGIVNGINTKVDVNVFDGNMWQLKGLTLD